jgi:hypothetical protein
MDKTLVAIAGPSSTPAMLDQRLGEQMLPVYPDGS